MSQERYNHPQPEYRADKVVGPFDKDKSLIQAALSYVEEASSMWALEPTEVVVVQPEDQDELIANLDSMLGSHREGGQLQRYLQGNLAVIRSKQSRARFSDRSVLNIKAGYDMKNLRYPGDNPTIEEYEVLGADVCPDREIVEDPDQTNIMVSGLLHATGANVIRDDLSEDGSVVKIYKGMLERRPVYFEEAVIPRTVGRYEPEGESRTVLDRSFHVITENMARFILNELSALDAEVLRSIGVEPPDMNSTDLNPDTYLNRSRMIDTVRLYAAMNL